MMDKYRIMIPFLCKYVNKLVISKQCSTCTRYQLRKFSVAHPKKDPVILKLSNAELKTLFTQDVDLLRDLFQKYGHELRVVGGAVRDILNNIHPHDFDFATTATPDQMIDMFERENIRILHTRGAKHGTVAIRVQDRSNFEVTTLRTDVKTDGRHAEVEFTTDWGLDARRRDLTINSMYLALDGSIYDYFGGYEDLKRKRIVFVGDANKRIQEDYLRILRYFRFFGRIVDDPNTYDEDTLKAIQENAQGLEKISGERIWSEFYRILNEKFVEQNVKKMLEVGLGPYMGLGDPKELNIKWFEKVCHLSKKHKFYPITYIAALLGENEKVLDFHSRVRLPNFDRDLARFLVVNRDDNLTEPPENPLRRFQVLMMDYRLKKIPIREFVTEMLKVKDKDQLLESFQAWQRPRFPINGALLLQKGIKSDISGSVMKIMRNMWIDSNFSLTQEELLDKLPELAEQVKLEMKKK